MRRYKYRIARLFHIALWSIILILSLNVLIKCIRILGPGTGGNSGESFETHMVTAACNYMMQSGIPILGYISGSEENENRNFILNTMIGNFPINRYIAQASDGSENNLIEDQNNALLFAGGNNTLFNNDLYVSKILEGIDSYNQLNVHNQTDDNTNNNDRNSQEGDSAVAVNGINGIMPIDIINGEVYLESEETNISSEDAKETLGMINGQSFTLNQLLNRQFLYNNFYIVDSATVVSDKLFDAEKLMGEDMTMKTTKDKPQILIYHTHSQETYSDSRRGKEEDTVVGVGTYLTKLLEDNYGYNVIHDKTKYDIMGGELDRNLAYNYACDGVEKILDKNPSIEVIIDLHRDGADSKRVTKIDGKDTAQIMLFNGLSRNSKGAITHLKNPYIQDNLAFSLQLQLKGREVYPGLMYKNYLQQYRYNMHLRKKSLLIELGTDKNTVEEAMNAMDYLSEILNEVLSGENK
ncbi:stage II sporulation protein P [Anaerocolumna sedimenticola]|uniref:Stage II sporulation protein P n=1 Tax=Anaerocolumna sedimenticola TaxID=2696063 RepID=A0A6P1TN76_9FIRM|nr:stage II sporulation protein P [Anaerocolumna sedimenticola]QHQ61923.1 stage II sporulation protein P [Anaerocolumna sedimenticola]